MVELAKKFFRFLSSILFYSIVLILVIAVLMFAASFVDKKISMNNGEYRSPLFGAYIIISESMIPHINVYDAVVTVRVDADSIKVDDIITFISKEIETAGTPITHRVIGIVYEDESKQKIMGFRTKGDHNNTADFALIAPNEVIGKVFLRIPMIGYLQTIMTKPIGWLLIVVLPCLFIIGGDVFKLIKTSKMKKSPTINKNIDNNSSVSSEEALENHVSMKNVSDVESNVLIKSDQFIENVSGELNNSVEEIAVLQPVEVVSLSGLAQEHTDNDVIVTTQNNTNRIQNIQNLEIQNIHNQNVDLNNQMVANDNSDNNIDNNQYDIDNII